MSKILFNYADVPVFKLQSKKELKNFINNIFVNESKNSFDLNYIFCSDAYILDINRRFLKHDYYTDIITFNLSEENYNASEIYISIETVKTNSAYHRTTFAHELLRVMFHGVLHLCGYGDKRKSEITIMRQKEDYYLQQYLQNN